MSTNEPRPLTMREHAQSQRQKVKITVVRRAEVDATPLTLAAPLGPCDIHSVGQEFIIENGRMPEGFCQSAWITLYPDIETLAWGGNFPWYKEKGTALRCCKDAVRTVTFKLERV
jgi:uncharacterized repeat protein (TIGR04076 family)